MIPDNNLRLHCFHGDGTENERGTKKKKCFHYSMETLKNMHIYYNLGIDTLCSFKCKITLEFCYDERNKSNKVYFT